jgi:hypothetical protein
MKTVEPSLHILKKCFGFQETNDRPEQIGLLSFETLYDVPIETKSWISIPPTAADSPTDDGRNQWNNEWGGQSCLFSW